MSPEDLFSRSGNRHARLDTFPLGRSLRPSALPPSKPQREPWIQGHPGLILALGVLTGLALGIVVKRR